MRQRLIRAMEMGFALPEVELSQINQRLVGQSVITCGCVAVMAAVLKVAGMTNMPLARITVLCAVGAALTVPFRRWLATGRALGTLVYAQFTTDLILITIGLAIVPDLPVVFHMQLLLIIIPCSLLSRRCGTFFAILSTAAHFLLAVGRTDLGVAGLLAPPFFYALTANQCFFYGRRLAAKTREAEHASKLSAALLRVASELAAMPDSAAVLARLAPLARELTGGSWASVLIRDGDADVWRVESVVTRRGFVDEETRCLPFACDVPKMLAYREADGCIAVRSVDNSFLPEALHARWRVGPYVAVALEYAGIVMAMLVVGQDDPDTAFEPLTRQMLAGIAHEAQVAVESARLVDGLRAASAVKSDFINAISHEFRSPLHAIIGFNDMLSDLEQEPDGGDRTERRDLLERVRRSSLRLLELVDRTLDVGLLEAGRLPVRIETVDLNALFGRLREETQLYWPAEGVRLDWEVHPLARVETDPGKLHLIVSSLLQNAAKFTERGHVTLRVTWASDARDPAGTARLTVVVTDTGIGIPADKLESIFEVFRQGDASSTRIYDGLGIGLYLIKRVSSLLGGEVQVRSTTGAGSEFTVELPVRLFADVDRVAVARAEPTDVWLESAAREAAAQGFRSAS